MEVVTQLAMVGFAHAILAATLFFFRPAERHALFARLWLVGQLSYSIALVLVFWRRTGSLFWFASVPNMLSQIGLGLTALAIASFYRRRLRLWAWLIALSALLQLFIREFGFAEHVRLALAITVNLAVQAGILALFAGRIRKGSNLVRFLAVGNALILMCYLLRAGEAAFASPGYTIFSAGIGQTIGLMGAYCDALLNGFGFLMVMAEDAAAELERLATLDPLTETMNRRSLLAAAEREVALAERAGFPLSVVIADLDHFKKINDQYGHAAGDTTIKTFVGVFREAIRACDCLGRWGGEEFVLVLPRCDAAGAWQLAARIREAFGATTMEDGGHRFSVTVSMGIAEHLKGESIAETIARADAALYAAKAAGRNRVEVAAEHSSAEALSSA